LHEAIVEVLSNSAEAMTARVIAAKVNCLGLYSRLDGLPVPPNQISARVNKYPHLFTRKNGLIGLQHRSPANLALARQRNQLPNTLASAGFICEEGDSRALAPIAGLPFHDVGIVGDLLATGLRGLCADSSAGVRGFLLGLDPFTQSWQCPLAVGGRPVKQKVG